MRSPFEDLVSRTGWNTPGFGTMSMNLFPLDTNKRNNLFVCGIPPVQRTSLGEEQISRIDIQALPVYTVDSIELNKLLYRTGDEKKRCAGISDIRSSNASTCVASFIPGFSEGDYLPKTVCPNETYEQETSTLTGKGMCILCQRQFAETHKIHLHMSPVGTPGGYIHSCIVQSSTATLPVPIPSVSVSKLFWETVVDKTGRQTRRVNESALVFVPSSKCGPAVISVFAHESGQYAQRYGITMQPLPFFIGLYKQVSNVIGVLRRYIDCESQKRVLLTEVKNSTGISIPAEMMTTLNFLPWTPSTHRPIQLLLAVRTIHLNMMLDVMKATIMTSKTMSEVDLNVTRYMQCILTQYLDATILTTINVLRNPNTLVQCSDISKFPAFETERQLVCHEQCIPWFVDLAKPYGLHDFIGIIRGILPISHKITLVNRHIENLVKDSESVAAIVLRMSILTSLLWNTCMHEEDTIEMEPISLHARHVLQSMSLAQLLLLLQWHPQHPGKRPIVFETVVRVFWLRLITVPKMGKQIGVIDPAGLIPEYHGKVTDVREELVRQCSELALIRSKIEEWCAEQPKTLMSGLFFSPNDLELETLRLPDYTSVLHFTKRLTRSRAYKQSVKRPVDDVKTDDVARNKRRKTSSNRNACQVIKSLGDIVTQSCDQGNRPSQHKCREPNQQQTSKRQMGQPPMKDFEHSFINKIVKNMPGTAISLHELRKIGMSDESLRVIAHMLKQGKTVLTKPEFDHMCKEILTSRSPTAQATDKSVKPKKRRSESGQRDMALFILYVSALYRNNGIRTQRLHDSVRKIQEAKLQQDYVYTTTGIRAVPVCPNCNVILASPSSARVASSRGNTSRYKWMRSQDAAPDSNTRTVLRKSTLPAQTSCLSFLNGHVRRVCPLCSMYVCEDNGTFVDLVGRVIHGVLPRCRMNIVSLVLCVNCLCITVASPDRRRGFGFCCISCDSIMGTIEPKCVNISKISHPASGKFSFIATPVVLPNTVTYKITCTYCHDIQCNNDL